MKTNFVTNLKTLLWQYRKKYNYKITTEKAVQLMTADTKLTDDRIWSLLNEHALPNDNDIKVLADVYSYTEDEIRYQDLIYELGVNVLTENICFLFAELAHGGKTDFAETMNIDKNTVTSWKRGQKPGKKNQKHMKDYFQLDANEDLEKSLLFLSLEPVGMIQKKKYCTKLIEEMSVKEFAEHYHSIKKLLS